MNGVFSSTDCLEDSPISTSSFPSFESSMVPSFSPTPTSVNNLQTSSPSIPMLSPQVPTFIQNFVFEPNPTPSTNVNPAPLPVPSPTLSPTVFPVFPRHKKGLLQ